MANERVTSPETATTPTRAHMLSIRDAVQAVFADASAVAVAEHLAAGRSVAGVLHGVPVTISPQTKPAGG